MHVALTEEQAAWQDAVGKLATTLSDAQVPPPEAGPPDTTRAWRELVGIGLPGLRSGRHTEQEPTTVESALAVEQLARRLSAAPAVGQAVIAPELLDAAGADDVLDALVAGDLRAAPALTPALDGFASGDGPAVAVDAAGAGHALLVRVEDGARRVHLVPIPPGAAPLRGLDLTRAVRPVEAGGAGEAVGGPIDDARWDRVLARSLVALSADLLGVMQDALDDAVEHAGNRRQFGVPIGSFQALQHLLADAATQVEAARGCVWHAAWSADHADPAAALLAAHTAKAVCSQAGVEVVEASVQTFGGLAITWEHRSHLRLRRVHLDRQLLGAEDHHFAAIAALRLAAGRERA